jgi:hypothetical protein
MQRQIICCAAFPLAAGMVDAVAAATRAYEPILVRACAALTAALSVPMSYAPW